MEFIQKLTPKASRSKYFNYLQGTYTGGGSVTINSGGGGGVTPEPQYYYPFTGATSSANGQEGLVPQPLAGQQNYWLRGNGAWAEFLNLTLQAGGSTGNTKYYYSPLSALTMNLGNFSIYGKIDLVIDNAATICSSLDNGICRFYLISGTGVITLSTANKNTFGVTKANAGDIVILGKIDSTTTIYKIIPFSVAVANETDGLISKEDKNIINGVSIQQGITFTLHSVANIQPDNRLDGGIWVKTTNNETLINHTHYNIVTGKYITHQTYYNYNNTNNLTKTRIIQGNSLTPDGTQTYTDWRTIQNWTLNITGTDSQGRYIIDGAIALTGNTDSYISNLKTDNLGVTNNLSVTGATILGGVVSSPSFSGGYVGNGWQIDADGNVTFNSLLLRDFLEVPELRKSRISVQAGILWISAGAGIIESVTGSTSSRTGTIKLKLEEGEQGTFAVNDLVQGIFSYDSGNATETTDDGKGNMTIQGFTTIKLKITGVSGQHNEYLAYQLKATTAPYKHPVTQMTISSIGNTTDQERQKSLYITRDYMRYLVNVNDWTYSFGNVAMQLGNLSNLASGTTVFSGYSAYLNNIYLRGVIKQISERTGEEIETINYKGDWSNTLKYYRNDEVFYNSSLWVAMSDNIPIGSTPSAIDWQEVSHIGTDGQGYIIKGRGRQISSTSAAGTTGEIGYISGGGVYQCVRSNTWSAVTADAGDAYYITMNNGNIDLIYYTGSGWTDYGDFRGATGPQGERGISGQTGIGVSAVTIEYYQSVSPTVMSGGTITPVYPTWENGKYLWTRQKITYTNSTVRYTDWTCANGAQGMAGKILRMRGLWQAGTTYYNDNQFDDIVIYNGDFYLCKQTTEDTTFTPSKWDIFNQFDNVATSVLLANKGYIDVLGAGRVFVGQTENADGWEMTQGKIRHTQTGLELTAEGEIYDPTGIHIKTGDVYTGNNPNIFPDPYFDARNPMWLNTSQMESASYGEVDYPWAEFDANLLHGKYFLRYDLSTSTGNHTVSPDMPRIQLKQNTTYTFSINEWHTTGITRLTILLRRYRAKTGGTYSSTSLIISAKNTKPTISFKTFTTNSTNVWFDFTFYYYTSSSTSGQRGNIDAFKLEESAVPTAMSDNMTDALLRTGIDIEGNSILATADNFGIRNNAGEKTLDFDAMGNMDIKGNYNSNPTIIDTHNYAQYIIPVNNHYYEGLDWSEYVQEENKSTRTYYMATGATTGLTEATLKTFNPFYSGDRVTIEELTWEHTYSLDVFMINGYTEFSSGLTGTGTNPYYCFVPPYDVRYNMYNTLLLPFMRFNGYYGSTTADTYNFISYRTPTNHGGQLHLITLGELRQLPNKRFTIVNNTGTYLHVLACGDVQREQMESWYKLSRSTSTTGLTEQEYYAGLESFWNIADGMAVTIEYKEIMHRYRQESSDIWHTAVDIVPVMISQTNTQQGYNKDKINMSEGFGADEYKYDNPVLLAMGNPQYNTGVGDEGTETTE